MRKLRDALPGLVMLGLAAVLLWLGVRTLTRQVAALDPNVVTALVAAAVALFGYFYSAWQAKSREIAEAHRAAKVAVYEQFFDIIEAITTPQAANGSAAGGKEQGVSPELERMFVKLTRGLIAWAGPGVIATWLKFRTQSQTPVAALLGVDDVLRAMRKDLGNSNWALSRGDLVKCFLKDPDELDRILGGQRK